MGTEEKFMRDLVGKPEGTLKDIDGKIILKQIFLTSKPERL